MANPSRAGAPGPADPFPEPLKTGSAVPASTIPPSAAPAPDIPAGMSELGGRREQRPSAGWLSAGVTETAQTAADAIRQQAVQFARDVGHELSTTGETQKARGVDAIRQFARAAREKTREREAGRDRSADEQRRVGAREIGGGDR